MSRTYGSAQYVVTDDGTPIEENAKELEVIATGSTEARTLGDRFADVVNVRDFGAVGDGTTDDTDAIQAALDSLSGNESLYFPKGEYGITTQLVCNTSVITIFGDSKYSSDIKPIAGWDGSNSLLHWGDGTASAYLIIRDMGFRAAQNSIADDTDGLSIHSYYNCDLFNLRCQGGNYVSRECAGLRIIDGRHTRVENSQFHNSYCHGMIIESHLNGLSIKGNAYDESDTGIRVIQETASDDNILEAVIANNEFGAARANTSYPAPSAAKCIDLGAGSHGRITLEGNMFSGGGGTEYHIYWTGFVEYFNISNNILTSAARYSIAQNGAGRSLNIANNMFAGNGDDGTDIDPANGVRDPDTTTYCADIYTRSAYINTTNIISNTTDITDRPMAWLEGTGGGLATSATQIVGNGTQATNIAYIHQTLIPREVILQYGKTITPV